jgi:hypothetical protein
MTTVAIHQPEYFPWLGYFDKLRRADTFVLLDTVQFDRSSLQQRTRVIGPNGPVWMTIPFVHRFPQRIDEVELADDRWRSKHAKTLQACYGKTAGYKSLRGQIDELYERKYDRLVDVGCASVALLAEVFGLGSRQLVRASSLAVDGSKGDLVLSICQHFGASRYLSGRTGASYLDAETFRAGGVEIEVQEYQFPEYARGRPLAAEEKKGLSALDAALWLGAEARSLFNGAT